jgi:hypothetical protein
MKQTAKMAMKTVTGVTAAVLALTGLSTHLVAGAALLGLVTVGAVCWVITDSGRSERLAMLIDAIHGNYHQGARRGGLSRSPVADPKQDKAA